MVGGISHQVVTYLSPQGVLTVEGSLRIPGHLAEYECEVKT